MLLSEIQNVCQNYGIKPSKSKGQNFLIDGNIIRKIIDGAGLTTEDTVLEIGPGLGVLTKELLTQAKRVIAVELDKQVIHFLRTEFKKEIKSKKLELIEGDVLKVNFRELGLADFNFKITANLPYSVTSQFFRQFLEHGPKPKEITVMIQKEVAQRMRAKKGEMNLLALSTQFFAEPEILFVVPPTCFWPAPAVDSAVIKLKLRSELPEVDIKLMFRLAKMGFASKRKQLHNNLSTGLKIKSEEVKAIFAEFGWREDIRAQDLEVDDWIRLAKRFI
jgi:16S rRNA (adenine1518-N6/adenine1519-N6)-dimethyltransferase